MIFQLFALCSLFALGSSATYDRINAKNVTAFWMETGFASVDNINWVSAATVATSFTDPIVLVSLPDIAGSNSSQGYPSSIRLQSISFATGSVSFSMRVILANDSFCVKTWYTPQNIVPALQISWMVVQKGAYLLDTHYYMAMTGSLTRTTATITSVIADPFVTVAYPNGCGSSTTRCTFPSALATSDLGAISTLQTFNNDRLLMVRCGRLRRQDINLVLTPHDATDLSYYVITTAETAGVFVYEQNVKLTCIEGISWETYRKTGVTSTFVTLILSLNYRQIPGAFGMLLTQNSLTDSTGLRVFERSYSSIKCITQEDQCVDEETVHQTAEDAGLIVVGSSNVTSNLACFIRYNANSDPTVIPSRSPTSLPSRDPTSVPTVIPSITPTATPSNNPTNIPSSSPSRIPTNSPSNSPSSSPTSSPSRTPTNSPTDSPSSSPSASPSRAPSSSPSSTPSRAPSSTPSETPTKTPSSLPTISPSKSPSASPTVTPTSAPSGLCTVTFPVLMTKS